MLPLTLSQFFIPIGLNFLKQRFLLFFLVCPLLVRWEALHLPLVQLSEEVCPLWRAGAPPQHAPEEPDQAAACHLNSDKRRRGDEEEGDSMSFQLVEKDAWSLVSGYGALSDLLKWWAQRMPPSARQRTRGEQTHWCSMRSSRCTSMSTCLFDIKIQTLRRYNTTVILSQEKDVYIMWDDENGDTLFWKCLVPTLALAFCCMCCSLC